MAAETLAREGDIEVTVYDRMPSVGRKFLMAGRGGLNLTHTEPLPAFLARYREAESWITPILQAFPPEATRHWCEALGQDTFVGSSGRVFPVAMKASPLLRAWLARLQRQGVGFALRHRWTGWNEGGFLRFEAPDGPHVVDVDVAVLALGGASWPRLGSDGSWQEPLRETGLTIASFVPANCGFVVDWTPVFRARFQGVPLKAVALDFEGTRTRGDLVVTEDGLEGGPLYAQAAPLREAIARNGSARVHLALRPDRTEAEISERVARRAAKESLATALKRLLKLPPVAIGLLHEAQLKANVGDANRDPAQLAALISHLPITLTAPFSLARAISTAGGLALQEINQASMIGRRPGVFAAGEMLDWEAPTGGYLMQACLASGAAAGRGALQWLRERPAGSAEAQMNQQAQQAGGNHRVG